MVTRIPVEGPEERAIPEGGYVVRWDPGLQRLVEGMGDPTPSQEDKIRRILAGGLIRLVRRSMPARGVRVDEYECHPVKGCKVTYTLKDVQTSDADGSVLHRLVCECQAARGTRVKKAIQCAHVLALQRRGFGGMIPAGGR